MVSHTFPLKFKTNQQDGSFKKCMFPLVTAHQRCGLGVRQSNFLMVGLEVRPWGPSLRGKLGLEEGAPPPPPGLGCRPCTCGPLRAGAGGVHLPSFPQTPPVLWG